MLTRATHLVTGFDWAVSGLVTTFVLGLAASVAVWWMLHDLFGRSGADRGTALIVFSPGALVLSLVYSEAATVLFVGVLPDGAAPQPMGGRRAVCRRGHHGRPGGVRGDRALRGGRRPGRPPPGRVEGGRGPGARPARDPGVLRLPVGPHRLADRVLPGPAGRLAGRHLLRRASPASFAHLFTHWFADPDYAVKAVSALVAVALLVVFFRARPPATWIGYVVAVLAFGAISPVIGVTPRLVLRGFPLLGVVGAKLPPLWFEVVLGLSALCMATLGAMAMGGPLWTP